MGFPCVSVKIPRCFHLVFLQEMVILLKLMVVALITHLGLLKPPEQLDPDDDDDPSTRYVLLLDGACPSPVPLSIHVLTALIKKKLPVLTYDAFLEKTEGGDELQDGRCSVCLEEVEGSHLVRELCNCRHVFHRECLERWVDEGHITCPLCRSLLFAEKTGVGDARLLQRDLLPLPHHR